MLMSAAVLLLTIAWERQAVKPPPPNIVVVLADDLGYGDVQSFNPNGKIPTPSIDRLARGGMRFTDAHTSSAVCTPTRYGLLTGRYNWRTTLQNGVLGGFSKRLIEPGRRTIPAFLKQHGYTTACVGKWHLGMDWPLKDGGFARDYPDGWKVDYSTKILNGPLSTGFDTYFGISASLDMPPYVFIRDDRATALPSVEKTWIRTGPAAADFEAIDVLPALEREALAIIERAAAQARQGRPFFLYLPMNAPHTPILPTRPWQGRSGLNPYADFVMQVDDVVGRLLDALERAGIAENTLVVFTSDNGCSPMANIEELIAQGHNPSGPLRGHKADLYEGGHRVPFVVRWPARVKAGSVSDQLVCLTDVFATIAEVLGASLPSSACEDGISFAPVMLGESSSKGPRREAIVSHSINGSFAIREGIWKLALCPGSGGWSAPRPGRDDASKLPPVQLFNLAVDLGERDNLQADHPEIVARLTKTLEGYVAEGRSTPGPRQPNAVPIDLFKAGRDAARPIPAKTKAKNQAKAKTQRPD